MPKIDTTSSVTPISANDCTRFCQKEMSGNYHTARGKTVAVMGGEDWEMWMTALAEAGVLAEGIKTTAYTYIGEKITWDIYWHGTIGAAKQDLDRRVAGIRELVHAPPSSQMRRAHFGVVKDITHTCIGS